MKLHLSILIILLSTTLFSQINLSPMWAAGDYWKPRTYQNHATPYSNYHAVDFYYGNRNRPDIYKNGDMGIAGRPILAPISGTLFIHLLDVTTIGNGNFPSYNAVRVFQGLDAVPKTCFSIIDSLGVTIRIDMSLEIDFDGNTKRINLSHLQINENYFNSTIQQKIRNAVRKFYNRTAIMPPSGLRREAIATGVNINAGAQVGTIQDWGIASQPHVHFQLFYGSPYSEVAPYLGTPQDLSNSSIITIEDQKIYEYEGTYNADYFYPAMLRRKYNLNETIVVNAQWDEGNGAKLRSTAAGNEITTILNGSVGTIKQVTPQYGKLPIGTNHLWYNIQFGTNIGWMAAEYIDKYEMQANLVLTESISLIQTSPYYVGQTVSGRFTIKNNSSNTIILSKITVGGRLNDDYTVRDFPSHINVSLPPNTTYTYQDNFTFVESGNYRFYPAYEINGIWKIGLNHEIPTEPGINDLIEITVSTASSPTINVSTNTLSSFGNVVVGQVSGSKNYTVSGNYLSANLIIQAPNGFEISDEPASNFRNVITLIPTGGTIASKLIYVRFRPTNLIQYNDFVENKSTGATQQNINVIGNGIQQQTGVTILASGLNRTRGITLDTDYIYFLDGGGLNCNLKKILKTGGAPITLVSGIYYATGISVDDNYIYYGENSGNGIAKIKKVNKSGGNPSIIADNQASLSKITIDTDHIYYTDAIVTNGSIRKVSKNGGSVQLLGTGTDSPVGLIIFNNDVYFTEMGNSTSLKKVSKNGGNIEIVAQHTSTPGIDFEALDVYWIDGFDAEIKKINTSNSSIDIIATGLSKPYDLKVDENYVFWVEYKVNGKLRQVSKNGGSILTLDSLLNMPVALAIDEAYIYWIEDNTAGTLKKVQKGIIPTKVEDQINNYPKDNFLYQNYPNPFNPTTTIKYTLPYASPILLKVVDMLGREIKILVNDYKSAGIYEVKFDAESLASGLYYYRLQAGDYVETKKMVLMK